MRLDRDSKQPIWLGLILIFAAFIFTLFFITSVRADDEVSEPPHDPQFNNLVFITVSDKMYIGGDTVIDFYSGSSDGANAIAWKSNFSSNLSGFFQYVPIDQCFFIIASDGASAGHLNSIREVLSDLGASYWSGDQDGFWNPDHDLSGYEDQRAPFGIYNVRYMSRLVKYLPVSPTPVPVSKSYNFIIKQERTSSEVAYFFFEFEALDFGKEVSLSTSYTLISTLVNTYSVYPIASVPSFVFRTGEMFNNGNNFSSGTAFYFTASSVSNCYVYNLGRSLVSSDPEYIKSNYSGTLLSLTSDSTSGGNILTHSSVYPDIYCLRSILNQGKAYQSLISSNILEYSTLSFSPSGSKTLTPFHLSGTDSDTFYYLGFKGLLSGSSIVQNPDISPTPSPSATPEPLPTSSESIHVILPTGTPSPTPPFSVPAEDPGGGGSGSPGGSSQGSLTPGQVNSTLNTFKQYTQNNGAFAFLYACTGLIPDDPLYFLFILLFILLLLACLRLFVHFTGG